MLAATTVRTPEPQEPQTMRDLMGTLAGLIDETARTFLLGRAVEFGAVAV